MSHNQSLVIELIELFASTGATVHQSQGQETVNALLRLTNQPTFLADVCLIFSQESNSLVNPSQLSATAAQPSGWPSIRLTAGLTLKNYLKDRDNMDQQLTHLIAETSFHIMTATSPSAPLANPLTNTASFLMARLTTLIGSPAIVSLCGYDVPSRYLHFLSSPEPHLIQRGLTGLSDLLEEAPDEVGPQLQLVLQRVAELCISPQIVPEVSLAALYMMRGVLEFANELEWNVERLNQTQQVLQQAAGFVAAAITCVFLSLGTHSGHHYLLSLLLQLALLLLDYGHFIMRSEYLRIIPGMAELSQGERIDKLASIWLNGLERGFSAPDDETKQRACELLSRICELSAIDSFSKQLLNASQDDSLTMGLIRVVSLTPSVTLSLLEDDGPDVRDADKVSVLQQTRNRQNKSQLREDEDEASRLQSLHQAARYALCSWLSCRPHAFEPLWQQVETALSRTPPGTPESWLMRETALSVIGAAAGTLEFDACQVAGPVETFMDEATQVLMTAIANTDTVSRLYRACATVTLKTGVDTLRRLLIFRLCSIPNAPNRPELFERFSRRGAQAMCAPSKSIQSAAIRLVCELVSFTSDSSKNINHNTTDQLLSSFVCSDELRNILHQCITQYHTRNLDHLSQIPQHIAPFLSPTQLSALTGPIRQHLQQRLAQLHQSIQYCFFGANRGPESSPSSVPLLDTDAFRVGFILATSQPQLEDLTQWMTVWRAVLQFKEEDLRSEPELIYFPTFLTGMILTQVDARDHVGDLMWLASESLKFHVDLTSSAAATMLYNLVEQFAQQSLTNEMNVALVNSVRETLYILLEGAGRRDAILRCRATLGVADGALLASKLAELFALQNVFNTLPSDTLNTFRSCLFAQADLVRGDKDDDVIFMLAQCVGESMRHIPQWFTAHSAQETAQALENDCFSVYKIQGLMGVATVVAYWLTQARDSAMITQSQLANATRAVLLGFASEHTALSQGQDYGSSHILSQLYQCCHLVLPTVWTESLAGVESVKGGQARMVLEWLAGSASSSGGNTGGRR